MIRCSVPQSGERKDKKKMKSVRGKQSLIFEHAPYLISAASVGGSKEAEGPLGKYGGVALK